VATRVRLRISLLSRSIMLEVRSRLQWTSSASLSSHRLVDENLHGIGHAFQAVLVEDLDHQVVRGSHTVAMLTDREVTYRVVVPTFSGPMRRCKGRLGRVLGPLFGPDLLFESEAALDTFVPTRHRPP